MAATPKAFWLWARCTRLRPARPRKHSPFDGVLDELTDKLLRVAEQFEDARADVRPFTPSLVRTGFYRVDRAVDQGFSLVRQTARRCDVPYAQHHQEGDHRDRDTYQARARSAQNAQAIRPFRVDVPPADLDDLRRRIAATRWPDRETVPDRSQGAQLAELQSSCGTGARTTTGGRPRRN
jgi:hypothetical protein